MLLERLSVYNYGVYAGQNDFELVSTVKKPIVLVGGHNGAGKTTILESMMIALYGKTYFGVKKTRKEYLDFMYKKIHKTNRKRANSASVEIAFRFYHKGSEDRYVINRSWTVNGGTTTESFSITKNDRLMSDIDESQWQTFIEGLLPLGIAKLFFFDGEKIVRVTENKEQYNREIKTSLETLIGAELVHRLRADLNLYVLRKSGNKNNTLLKDYEKLTEEKNQLIHEVKELNQEREKITSKIDEMVKKIALKESTISGIGGGYADMRGDLLTQKAVLEEKIRVQTKQFQEELSGDAPFYLVSSMLSKIHDKIQNDSKTMYGMMANMNEGFLQGLEKMMSDSQFWPSGVNAAAATKRMLEAFRELGNSGKDKVHFDLSPVDIQYFSDMIKRIDAGSDDMVQISTNLVKIQERAETVESDIARIPKDDELGPRITEINEMHQEMGILKGELTHLEQQISSKSSYRKILQGKLKAMLTSIYNNKTASTGMQLASKMQDVLDTYYSALKERKIRELESNLLYTARMLLHKESIRKIEIDRDTFEVKVFENNEDQIPGDFLSMGERQIVGTALLWAIARMCGRSLPFVIDTPLGRLDGQHLTNLVEKFYPFASHQIILLSTDREISPKEYDMMSKYVTRSYKITCDKRKSVTTVEPGYFMEGELAQIR